MKCSLLVVEGPDDLVAIRSLLKHIFGGEVHEATDVFTREDRSSKLVWVDAIVYILIGRDKDRAAERLINQLNLTPPPDIPFTQVGSFFDPDSQSDDEARAWLKCKLESKGVSLTGTEDGNFVTAQTIPVLCCLWNLGDRFNDLDDQHNLERVAIEILNVSTVAEAEIILGFLCTLSEKSKRISWKTAFRLWSAMRYPDNGAMEQVFGQDESVRTSIGTVLKDSQLLTSLKRLAGTKAVNVRSAN